MNQVHIDWVENKSADWKIATVTDMKYGKKENVSINRANKKGEIFPNFDGITPGADIYGDLWQSPAGKWYLFEAKTQGFANSGKGSQMTKVMEKKAENIEKSQDRKEEGIKLSSTFRAAVDIALAQAQKSEFPLSSGELKINIELWRQYLWQHWDAPESYPPFS